MYFVSIYMYVHKAAKLTYQANNVHLFFGKVLIRIACKGWARKAQATRQIEIFKMEIVTRGGEVTMFIVFIFIGFISYTFFYMILSCQRKM